MKTKKNIAHVAGTDILSMQYIDPILAQKQRSDFHTRHKETNHILLCRM